MASEMLLVREGTKLGAAEPLSYEILQGLKLGEMVTCTIRRTRNAKHHRKFFALLSAIWEAQSFYATLEGLLDDLKIATGHCRKEPSKTAPGGFRMVPLSISFARMDQTGFDQFYRAAVEFVLREILPGVEESDLEARVIELLNQKKLTTKGVH